VPPDSPLYIAVATPLYYIYQSDDTTK
jgi:hypothetical protein